MLIDREGYAGERRELVVLVSQLVLAVGVDKGLPSFAHHGFQRDGYSLCCQQRLGTESEE